MQASEMRGLLAVAAVVALASCGGGGSSPAPEPGPIVTPPPVVTPPVNGPAWTSYGSDAQHSSLAKIATQPLKNIAWQAPVDLAPPYTAQGYLLVHYGSPVITSTNTVIFPVRKSGDTFRIEARDGGNGAVKWTLDSDYVMPAHNWRPPYGVTLTRTNRVYAAAAGGKVLYRDNADSASSTTQNAFFYDAALYSTANKAALDAGVIINTPITADSAGNIWFGFTAATGNPANLKSGVARIGADGKGSWAAASTIAADAAIVKVALNSAPALSTDEKTLYVAVNSGYTGYGYLVALDAATLAAKSRVKLMDPYENVPAKVTDDSTAAPTVAPDGEVYYGVLEATSEQHNQRGWLLHYSADLAQTLIPGSFGWDDTPSIVPATMVPSYTGTSSYLITTKYNNYGRAGSGDSKNKVAVLDPHAAQADPVPQTANVQVMKEILTILGPTADPSFPGGVTEWCVNVAAVDPATKSILVNSEDGNLYRWNLATNTLSEKVKLTSGLGESYTPTAVGPDGKVYAINNAVLFAVGQ